MTGWNLTHVELGVNLAQLNAIFQMSALALFIIFLLSLYLAYNPLDLNETYKRVLATLVAVSFIGLFFGGAVGQVLGVLCTGEAPNVIDAVISGLSTSVTLFLQYSLGGFAAIALSYFKALNGSLKSKSDC